MIRKSNLLIHLGLLLLSSERLFIHADTKLLITTGFMITNQRVKSVIPYENEAPVVYRDCGGIITKSPGTIETAFTEKKSQGIEAHCVWKLYAPNNHRIYLRDLEIIRTSTSIAGFRKEDFSDAPVTEVYDGCDLQSNNRLFRFGNDTLSNCISSGQYMTIELHHRISEKFIEEKVILNYGFANDTINFNYGRKY